MIKRFLICFFFLGNTLNMYPQKPDTAAKDSVKRSENAADSVQRVLEDAAFTTIPTDTILLIHSIFLEQDTINRWKKKKEFAYIKNLDSLLKAQQEKENKSAQSAFAPPNVSFLDKLLRTSFFKNLFWLLAIFFVAIIIYQLLKNKVLFKRIAVRKTAEEISLQETLLPADDYEELVHQSCRLGDYRMAVRYLFLKTLQQLSRQNLVEWAKEKTNTSYLVELPQQWRNDFKKLVYHYEYVWYGNFAVSKEQFETVQKQYTSFLQKI